MKILIELPILLLCKLICSPFCFFPAKLQRSYALMLARVILRAFPRSKYVVHRNLQLCFPNMNYNEREKIRRSMKQSLADNFLANFQGPKLHLDEVMESLDFSGCEDIMEEIVHNKGTGYLFLTAHYGSFELLSHFWSIYDKPFAILARGFGLDLIDSWWNKRREATGSVVFNRNGGFKQIINHLKGGNNVAILFDQNVKKNHGIFVPFFGIPASTTKTVALASLKTSCKIVFTTMIPKEDGGHRFILKEVTRPENHEGTHQEKIYKTIVEAHTYLEETISKEPQHWFWIHRRFKTRPEGEAEDLYDEKKYPILD